MRTLFLSLFVLSSNLQAVEITPEDLLRQGLFEEEANRDFDKAAERYRAVVAAHDRQRALAATATFRLGEIARKKNEKEAAAAAFRTVIERFPEQEDLSRLSKENLVALGMAPAATPAVQTPSDPEVTDPEDVEITRLKEIARNSPDLLDGADGMGWRPLHQAAMKGQSKMIFYLLENNANPNSRTIKQHLTPLQIASIQGHLEAVKALIGSKADLNSTLEIVNCGGDVLPPRDEKTSYARGDWSALDLAILFDRREVARALIAAGADIKRSGPDLDCVLPMGLADSFLPGLNDDTRILPLTALQLAIELRRDELASELLKAGAPLTTSDYKNAFSPLQSAVLRNPDFVETLLKAKANPNIGFPAYGITPLHEASNSGLVKVARLLIDAGADPKAVDSTGRTPLHAATTAEMVDLLVSKGADPNAKDKAGLTPLDVMVGREEATLPKAVEALLNHGVVVADARTLLQRTCAPLLPLVRERVVYPKEQRRDVILLSLGGNCDMGGIPQHQGGYLAEMEVCPASGSPTPSLAEGLWPFLHTEGGMSSNSRLANIRILRRKEVGKLETLLDWTPTRNDATRKDWPGLEWGDIVELNCTDDNSASFSFFGYPFGKIQPRNVTVRLESWSRSSDWTDNGSERIWVRNPLGNIEVTLANFVDRTHFSVSRKSVEKPIAVDLEKQNYPGFRLIDGDVIDFHFSENFWVSQVSAKSVNVINQMLQIKQFDPGDLIPTIAGFQQVRTDWSKVRIIRRGKEQASKNVDLVAWVRSLPPREKWNAEEISTSDQKLQPGDVVMIPPSRAGEEERKVESETSAKIREVADFLQGRLFPPDPPAVLIRPQPTSKK